MTRDMNRTPEQSAIERVGESRDNLYIAKNQVRVAEVALRDEVVKALAAGVPVTRVAEALCVSRARVYQIRDGRR
jgi:hypothetical protein